MYKFAKKVANHEGFTLVELIVVIAILGILAGIAIPVYSGYIKKANQAADVMLLGAVNTALAAACAENDFARLSDCALDIKNEKIAGIIPEVETMDDDPAAAVGTMDLAGKIAASFLVYFGNNTETPLKYAKTADKYVFNNTDQTFSIVGGGDGTSESGTTSLEDIVNNLKDQILAAIADSSFAGNEDKILNDMQGVTNAAYSVATNEAADLVGMLGGTFGSWLTDQGVDTSDPAAAQQIANYASLFVAQQLGTAASDATVKQQFKDMWAANTFSNSQTANAFATQYRSLDGISTLGSVAAAYATTEGLMNYISNQMEAQGKGDSAALAAMQAAFDSLPAQLAGATSSSQIINIIGQVKSDMGAAVSASAASDLAGAQAIQTLIGSYGSAQGADDAEAFLTVMDALNSNFDALANYTDESDLYSRILELFGH